MRKPGLTLLLAWLALPALGLAAELRAEPEIQPAAAVQEAPKAHRAPAASVRHVDLGAFAPDLSKTLTATGRTGTPLQIGFARPVAELATPADFSANLAWQPLPEGGQVAALSVASPGAAGVRMGLRIESIPDGTVARFYAPGEDGATEVDATQLRALAAPSGTYWSPIVEADTIVAEIAIPAGASASDVRIASPTVSHLVASASTTFVMPKAAAAACNNDVMCYQGTWALESSAVARIVFTDAGSSYLCSGTLVADKDTTTFVPYFLTANHCVSTQASAASVQSYWFYRATACNSGVKGAYQTLSGGATLLYATDTTDTSFMRLNGTPPGGVGYVGWNVGSVPVAGSSVTGIHHPQGDLQKIAFGDLRAYSICTASGADSFDCQGATANSATFYTVNWTSGLTEGGSSGSSLFLDNGRYLLGQLYGGDGSCNAVRTDYYGRFDLAYNAALSQWLGGPGTTTAAATTSANNYSDMWWNAAESGWGISITQHGSTIFAAWYVYDANGRPLWVVMPGGQWSSSTSFSGDLYTTTGDDPTGTFDPASVVRTRVGSATLDFASLTQATLSYTVNGASGSRPLTREPFGPVAAALSTNYADLWWNASESGWGLSINQQYQTLFAVWYTYGADRVPTWYVMSGGSWVSSGAYSGTLYRTSAAPVPFFGASRFDANSVTRTAVGSLTLRFTGANAATMTYSINGVSGTKSITRQPF